LIASINCVSFSEWTNFAKEIELAGADAIELNISIYPSDIMKTTTQYEETYIDILNEVVKNVNIPVSLKISTYFSSLAKTALRFSFTGIKGLVLFNRLYSPDIDIDTFQIIPGNVFSSPDEIALPVRWASILSERVSCDIAASTGIHDGRGLVKVLLAGAKAAQICSVLYMNGFDEIRNMLHFLEDYMDKHGFSNLDQVIGKMSMRNTEDPAALDRVQFMKHFIDVK
jgi:dihydroorotate dehydrogenase (fumarate)